MAKTTQTRLNVSWRQGDVPALLAACIVGAGLLLAWAGLADRCRLDEPMDVQWNKVAQVRQKIDPNVDPPASLRRLHMIGPVRAKAIVDYRQAHGPRAFATIDDLDKVYGIGPATLEQFRDQLEIRQQALGTGQ